MTSESVSQHGAERLSAPVPVTPEDRTVFRLAQLLLLFETTEQLNAKVATVDRIGYFDFLAANPFLVLDGTSERDDRDRVRLRLAGFSGDQLSYASTGQRFASRRRRIEYDLSLLVSYNLVVLGASGYHLTDAGRDATAELNSLYADAYRGSARIIVSRLKNVGDRPLRQRAEKWLGQSWLLLDLLEDVTLGASTTAENERGEHA